jgi:hypothetical protein
MLITPRGTFPLVGRREGQIYTAPGLTNVGRSRVVPLQPRSNQAITRSIAVATVAQWWKLLSPATQALWLGLFGNSDTAYNNFVAVNSNAVQWGSSGIIESPYAPAIDSIDFAVVYAEPDGVQTTFYTVLSGMPSGLGITYAHLYLNFSHLGGTPAKRISSSTYFGSFGPCDITQFTYFDVTDLWTAATGQWWYPRRVDTASQSSCGNYLEGFFWVSDEFGMPREKPDKSVEFANLFAVEPISVAAGVCPILTTPPYPWPPSH